MEAVIDFSAYPVANAFMRGMICRPERLTPAAITEANALKEMFGDTPIEDTVFGQIDEAQRGTAGAITFDTAIDLAQKAIAAQATDRFRLPSFSSMVPETVISRVKFALSSLTEIRQGIDNAARLEESVGMPGRYQADAFLNRRADIERAQSVLSEFKALARKNFVAPDLLLRELGGEPDLTPSLEAQAWIDDPRGPAISRPKFGG